MKAYTLVDTLIQSLSKIANTIGIRWFPEDTDKCVHTQARHEAYYAKAAPSSKTPMTLEGQREAFREALHQLAYNNRFFIPGEGIPIIHRDDVKEIEHSMVLAVNGEHNDYYKNLETALHRNPAWVSHLGHNKELFIKLIMHGFETGSAVHVVDYCKKHKDKFLK